MRHLRHCLALLPLLAAGCRYPEDPVFAYGRALNPDGSPLAGATVSVERAPPRESNYTENGEPPPETRPVFSPYATSTVQANGDFTVQFLTGEVEEWASDYAYLQYRFRASLPLKDGEGTFIYFTFSGDMELPTLQRWDARLTVGEGAQGPTLSFAPAPPAPELPPSGKPRIIFFHGLEGGEETVTMPAHTTPESILQLFAGGERLWMESGVSAPWVPGPYVLEDFASPEAQLRAVALGQWSFSPLGTTGSHVLFRQEWRTARTPLPAGTARPVSRGASCEPSPSEVCPFTDGRLTPVVFSENRAVGEMARSITVTLAEPMHLSRAVIRGLDSQHAFEGVERLLLEGSADGEHWVPLTERRLRDRTRREAILRSEYENLALDTAWNSPFDEKLELYDQAPRFFDLPLKTLEPVRHVRLSLDRGQSEAPLLLFSLAEVSLFP
ncbi:hypothetical protein [Archangium sp.]|jgi:hypothetical protein|uniref:hypothetical protein n=1 Tax=Archangium sp. TaxID=1872627 RepID=UPI002ED975B8